jgi:beta-lactamase superfamily II metal-dependent hydrolase
MTKENTARKTLWPADTRIVLRVCFLYVGQGSSILVLVRDGTNYRALLVDCNLDKKNGGIDVPKMLADLLPDKDIYAFVNTHPHDDHLCGVVEIRENFDVEQVWHSGHIPSKKYGSLHPELQKLIDKVKQKNGGNAIVEIDGSRSPETLFDAEVHFLAPAEHVKDDVNEEEADTRYRRIHENCSVVRFGKGKSHILVTGDADLVAFRNHITDYHKDRLPACVLDASHHGSRSFFMENEGDDPYLDALEAIDPQYVVISAPTRDESRHGHPHEDAVKLYADHVGKDNVLHMGKDRESFFFDIYEDGTHSGPQSDKGALAEAYGLDKDEDDGGDDGSGSGKGGKTVGPFVRPSGPGEYTPRKYAGSVAAARRFA